MWSGPRNLSTALMRSFSSRADCVVSDEPFYASYLARTGLDHPGRADVLASQPTDWQDVAEACGAGPPPLPCAVWYQKHMSHHVTPEIAGPWLDGLDHALLIRHPARVIASYLKVWPTMTLQETGLPSQVAIVEHLARTRGIVPPVVDAADLRAAPDPTLRGLCAALDLAWDPAMLHWPPGPHPQDGVWGRDWYASTWGSTGFRPEPAEEELGTTPCVPFLDEAVALYDRLRACCNSVAPRNTRSS
jgi:hypothetical protein